MSAKAMGPRSPVNIWPGPAPSEARVVATSMSTLVAVVVFPSMGAAFLPPLAYIGLLIVWFGIGDQSKIWLLFLAAFLAVEGTAIVLTRVTGQHWRTLSGQFWAALDAHPVVMTVVLGAGVVGLLFKVLVR